MNTYDTTFEDTLEERNVDVRFFYDFTPGRPAFTPRGEYGPIDPPDPPEISVTDVQVRGTTIDGKMAWVPPEEPLRQWIMARYQGDIELQADMILEAERWLQMGPDPDRLYDERQERLWDKD